MLIYRYCATPLNWTAMAWSSSSTSTTKQNPIYQFFRKGFNQRWLQFLFAYSLANDLQCHVFFSFWKTFDKCLSLSVNGIKLWWRQRWRHLQVTVLHCWAKFSNVLVRWSIRMICAKNYETVSKFVKVMPRILWPLFFPDTVYTVPIYRTFRYKAKTIIW